VTHIGKPANFARHSGVQKKRAAERKSVNFGAVIVINASEAAQP
jgi:hypothetical protein